MPGVAVSAGPVLAPGGVGAGRPILRGGLALQTQPPIRFPVAQSLYVRKTGSDSNGGSSVSTSPTATGTDGVTDGSPKFTSASAAFDASYVDELINIVGVGRFRIEAVVDATTLTLSANAPVGSGQTWNVGGAVLTIGALIGNANAAVREGDTIWVGSGTYRELLKVNVATRNGVGPKVQVKGDVDGTQTGDAAGMVRTTVYLAGDKAAPTQAPAIDFMAGVSWIAFSNLFVHGVNAAAANQRAALVNVGDAVFASFWATSQQVSFTDCVLYQTAGPSPTIAVVPIAISSAFGMPLSWTFDRCRIFAFSRCGAGIWLSPTGGKAGMGADWSLDVLVKNSMIFTGGDSSQGVRGGMGVQVVVVAGGVTVRNCTLVSGGSSATVFLSSFSTALPSAVTNSVVLACGTGGSINTGASATEDYNVLQGNSTATAGGHSISDGSYAPLLHLGQELIWGALLRHFLEPMDGSPLAGFGNDGNQAAYDLRNQPRPAGGGNALAAVGALERSNTFAKETGTVHTGTNAISATGAAYQDFLVPVASGTSYTISVYTAYDGSYTGTAPQVKLVNGTEAGVADQTVTAGGSAGGGFVQVSLAPFTPTSNGFVTVRVQSNDTSGVSETVFDSFAVA